MQLPVLGLAQSPLPAIRDSSVAWKVGQLVNAIVLRNVSAHTAMLSVQGDRLMAATPGHLPVGQQLLLRVSALSPQPLLQLVAIPPSVVSVPTDGAGAAWEYSGFALQRLLNTLVWLATDPKHVPGNLPASVRTLIGDVLSGVRTAQMLTIPDNLRQALWDGGLLLEARLASISLGLPATGPLACDFKGRLLRLRRALNQHRLHSPGNVPARLSVQCAGHALVEAPSLTESPRVSGTLFEQLFATIETVLRGIEAWQFKSLASGAREGFSWHVEIPFWCGDRARTIVVAIERHGPPGDLAQATVWRASLTLDTDGFGIIHARFALTGRNVAVQVWASHSVMLARLSAQAERLANGLFRLGLSVMRIRWERGMPTDGSAGTRNVIRVHA